MAHWSANSLTLVSSALVCMSIDLLVDCSSESSSMHSTSDIRHCDRRAFPFLGFRLMQMGICSIIGSEILRSLWSFQTATQEELRQLLNTLRSLNYLLPSSPVRFLDSISIAAIHSSGSDSRSFLKAVRRSTKLLISKCIYGVMSSCQMLWDTEILEIAIRHTLKRSSNAE